MEFSCKLPFALLFFFSLLTISAYAQDSPDDYVSVHNEARSEVGVPDIVWDDSVAEYAQNYANQRTDCRLLFSGGSYSETIEVSDRDLSGADAVRMWVARKKYYNYDLNLCIGGDCKEYTQVVWRSSIRLGCAKVRCDNGGTFIICNYYPRGNIPGERPY